MNGWVRFALKVLCVLITVPCILLIVLYTPENSPARTHFMTSAWHADFIAGRINSDESNPAVKPEDVHEHKDTPEHIRDAIFEKLAEEQTSERAERGLDAEYFPYLSARGYYGKLSALVRFLGMLTLMDMRQIFVYNGDVKSTTVSKGAHQSGVVVKARVHIDSTTMPCLARLTIGTGALAKEEASDEEQTLPKVESLLGLGLKCYQSGRTESLLFNTRMTPEESNVNNATFPPRSLIAKRFHTRALPEYAKNSSFMKVNPVFSAILTRGGVVTPCASALGNSQMFRNGFLPKGTIFGKCGSTDVTPFVMDMMLQLTTQGKEEADELCKPVENMTQYKEVNSRRRRRGRRGPKPVLSDDADNDNDNVEEIKDSKVFLREIEDEANEESESVNEDESLLAENIMSSVEKVMKQTDEKNDEEMFDVTEQDAFDDEEAQEIANSDPRYGNCDALNGPFLKPDPANTISYDIYARTECAKNDIVTVLSPNDAVPPVESDKPSDKTSWDFREVGKVELFMDNVLKGGVSQQLLFTHHAVEEDIFQWYEDNKDSLSGDDGNYRKAMDILKRIFTHFGYQSKKEMLESLIKVKDICQDRAKLLQEQNAHSSSPCIPAHVLKTTVDFAGVAKNATDFFSNLLTGSSGLSFDQGEPMNQNYPQGSVTYFMIFYGVYFLPTIGTAGFLALTFL
eukprot:Nk52_evm4s325 gene=Nk52_evmTU4s325